MPLPGKRFCEHMESSLHLPTELSNTGTQGVLFPSVHHRLVPPPTSGLPCLSVRRLPSIPEDGLVHPRDSQDVEATIKEEVAHCFEFTRRLRNSQRYAQASLIPRLSLINRPCIDCGKRAGRRHDLALYNIGGCAMCMDLPRVWCVLLTMRYFSMRSISEQTSAPLYLWHNLRRYLYLHACIINRKGFRIKCIEQF